MSQDDDIFSAEDIAVTGRRRDLLEQLLDEVQGFRSRLEGVEKQLAEERRIKAELERGWGRQRLIYHVLMEAMPQASFAYDADLNIIFHNRAARELGGLDAPTTVTEWLAGALDGRGQPVGREHWEALVGGHPVDSGLILARGRTLTVWSVSVSAGEDPIAVLMLSVVGEVPSWGG